MPVAASCPTLTPLPACACVYDQYLCVNILISPLEYVYSCLSSPCFSDLFDEIVLRFIPPLVPLFPVFFFSVRGGVRVHVCLDDEKIIRVFYYTSRNDTHLSHTEAREIEPIPRCFPSPCNAIMPLSFHCPCLCSWAPNYHPAIFVSHRTSSDIAVA